MSNNQRFSLLIITILAIVFYNLESFFIKYQDSIDSHIEHCTSTIVDKIEKTRNLHKHVDNDDEKNKIKLSYTESTSADEVNKTNFRKIVIVIYNKSLSKSNNNTKITKLLNEITNSVFSCASTLSPEDRKTIRTFIIPALEKNIDYQAIDPATNYNIELSRELTKTIIKNNNNLKFNTETEGPILVLAERDNGKELSYNNLAYMNLTDTNYKLYHKIIKNYIKQHIKAKDKTYEITLSTTDTILNGIGNLSQALDYERIIRAF